MSCKGGMNQYLVETIIKSVLLEMLNDGTLQAGLKKCDAACDDYLGKGTQVVTCEQLPSQICAAISADLDCLPFVETFTLIGTTLTLTLTDGQTFVVNLSSLVGTDVFVSKYEFIGGDTLRITQNDGSVFNANVSSLKLTANDINTFITTNTTIRNNIASVFTNCANVPHQAGAQVPSCADMTIAINTAISTAYDTQDKFLEMASFDIATNALSLTVKNGATFVIPLAPVPVPVVGVEPVITVDTDVPTASVGEDVYLLGKPAIWEKRIVGGIEYSTPLYLI